MTTEQILSKVASASSIDLNILENKSNEAVINNVIPKIIHFCFLDWQNMSEPYLSYLNTWFETLDDSYTFVNWTPILSPLSCEFETYMYNNNKFAFYSDYIRVAKVFQYGGIYLERDVMVFKDFSPLLDMNYAFDSEVSFPKLECAVFMTKKNNRFLGVLKNEYENETSENYISHPKAFVAPTYWSKKLFKNNVSVNWKTCSDMNVYRQYVTNDPENFLLTLDGTYFSCTDVRLKDVENPNICEHSYCVHGFETTWTF